MENPGIYLWFNLTNMPFMYKTPCINKCMKYSCYVLTEQFLSNLWRTFCDRMYCHAAYTRCLFVCNLTLLGYDSIPEKVLGVWKKCWNFFVSSGNPDYMITNIITHCVLWRCCITRMCIILLYGCGLSMHSVISPFVLSPLLTELFIVTTNY